MFWDLHVAIQSAMGWEDDHFHMFRIGRRSEIIIYGNPSGYDFGFDGDENTFNGWETEVSSCPYQSALIHIKRSMTENRQTAKGRLMYERHPAVRR